jgi:hypothetical protein
MGNKDVDIARARDAQNLARAANNGVHPNAGIRREARQKMAQEAGILHGRRGAEAKDRVLLGGGPTWSDHASRCHQQ